MNSLVKLHCTPIDHHGLLIDVTVLISAQFWVNCMKYMELECVPLNFSKSKAKLTFVFATEIICSTYPLCKIFGYDGAHSRHNATICTHWGHTLATLAQQLWRPIKPRPFHQRLNCEGNISALWRVTRGSHSRKMCWGAMFFNCDAFEALRCIDPWLWCLCDASVEWLHNSQRKFQAPST